jgi:hypothetical protein
VDESRIARVLVVVVVLVLVLVLVGWVPYLRLFPTT